MTDFWVTVAIGLPIGITVGYVGILAYLRWRQDQIQAQIQREQEVARRHDEWFQSRLRRTNVH